MSPPQYTTWTTARIGEVSEVKSGIGFPKEFQGRKDGEFPVFKVGDISTSWKAGEVYLRSSENSLASGDARLLRATPFPAGTTVFAKIGAAIALNRRAVLATPAICDNNVMGLIPNTSVLDSLFLYHFMCTVKLGDIARATTVPSIRAADVSDITIPLPPLDEQRRIVEAIETQLTRLDAAVAALKRAQANLKRYRASVLKAAVEGHLVPTEAELARRGGREFESGSEWLASLGIHASPASKIDGWRQVRFKELWLRGEYGTSIKCSADVKGTPVLRIPNIARGDIDLSDLKYATVPLELDPVAYLRTGDLLICRTNGSLALIGKTAFIRQDLPSPHYFASYLLRFRLKSLGALPSWCHLVLSSEYGRNFIESNAASSAGQHNISLSLLQDFVVPIPPPLEQQRIVDEMERVLSIVEVEESSIANSLTQAAKLKAAVLQQAYSGRLTEDRA